MITTFYATSQFISTQRGADETRMVFGMNELLPRFIPWNYKKNLCMRNSSYGQTSFDLWSN